MQDVANEIEAVIAKTVPELIAIGEAESGRDPGPGRWSKKEILGHLVDSAFNNHQRFVRAQLVPALVFPGYEQEGWVAAQGYRDRPWDDLVRLWAGINAHLSHVIARIPPERLPTLCTIGSGAPVTLEFVARDYVRHLRHHLAQIFDPAAAEGKRHAPFAERPRSPRLC